MYTFFLLTIGILRSFAMITISCCIVLRVHINY